MNANEVTQPLSEDAMVLLQLLPPVGRITNKTALQLTGWEMERLVKAKFELRGKGLVEIKASFGGPFGRIETGLPIAKTSKGPQAEREDELYLPFQKWVMDEFLPDGFDKEKDLFEVVVSGNKRPQSAGAWQIPDLISISLKKYKYIPTIQMETATFEVKKSSDAFGPYGIFEAISHSKFGNQTFYCFEWQDKESFFNRGDYQRIEQEASIHGVGLIRLWFVDDKKQHVEGEIIHPAERHDPDPSTLSSFIDRFVPEDTKKRIIERTAHNLYW
jgi:hypothetical protein